MAGTLEEQRALLLTEAQELVDGFKRYLDACEAAADIPAARAELRALAARARGRLTGIQRH